MICAGVSRLPAGQQEQLLLYIGRILLHARPRSDKGVCGNSGITPRTHKIKKPSHHSLSSLILKCVKTSANT
jgi:hypothetical protein